MRTKRPLIRIGKLSFAASASALVDSLFNPGGTNDGFYRVRKNGVLFMRPDGSPRLFLVANLGQSRFFVSASSSENGKTRYLYSTTSADDLAIGLSWKEKNEVAESVWNMLCNNGGAA